MVHFQGNMQTDFFILFIFHFFSKWSGHGLQSWTPCYGPASFAVILDTGKLQIITLRLEYAWGKDQDTLHSKYRIRTFFLWTLSLSYCLLDQHVFACFCIENHFVQVVLQLIIVAKTIFFKNVGNLLLKGYIFTVLFVFVKTYFNIFYVLEI